MLTLVLPAIDDQEAVEVHLEHSLVSLSKWESIHKKPFFDNKDKDADEFRSYIYCMLLTEIPEALFASRLPLEHFAKVRDYINDSQTATTFREDRSEPPSREVITAEVIYYWLIAFRIPFQPIETWHLSRLMTVVRICGIKQSKPRKMTPKQQMAEYKRLNEQRRREMGTSG